MIRLDQINLVAADMEATLAFYRLLGVKVPAKAIWKTKTGMHHIGIEIGGMGLDFDSQALARHYNAGYRRGRAGGNVVIGFAVSSRAAVDKIYAKLTCAGHRGLQPPWDAFWGARYAIVADPDGNHVGIMSPVNPRKRWAAPDV